MIKMESEHGAGFCEVERMLSEVLDTGDLMRMKSEKLSRWGSLVSSGSLTNSNRSKMSRQPSNTLTREGSLPTAPTGKIVRQPSKLSRHMSTKSFRCPFEECGKDFNKKYNMQMHLRQHTGEKPYICTFNSCGLSFKWRSSLRNHMRYHFADGKVPDHYLSLASKRSKNELVIDTSMTRRNDDILCSVKTEESLESSVESVQELCLQGQDISKVELFFDDACRNIAQVHEEPEMDDMMNHVSAISTPNALTPDCYSSLPF